jgi:hypothetical protein
VKIYIEEFLATFGGFHQTIFSILAVHSLQQLFSQLTAHSNFFHSHSPAKQTPSYGGRGTMGPSNSNPSDDSKESSRRPDSG